MTDARPRDVPERSDVAVTRHGARANQSFEVQRQRCQAGHAGYTTGLQRGLFGTRIRHQFPLTMASAAEVHVS